MKLAGFDIGGTKCAVILGEETANGFDFLSRIEFKTEGSPETVIEKLVGLLHEEMRLHGCTAEDLKSVGISCGGPLNSKAGMILSPPNLLGWDNVPIVKLVQDALGVPTFLCNDADACALAEWTYGAGKGCEDMIFLTFGTGLGAGLILNGALYTGKSNSAGEVGHIRLAPFGPAGYGKSGSFEGFCSGAGIAQLARIRILEQLQIGRPIPYTMQDAETMTAKKLAAAAHGKEPLALGIFREAGEYLGRGLAVLADILNPECIVIGGVFMRAGQYMESAMRESLKREALSVNADLKVVPAALGEQIGDYAALTIAKYNLERTI